MAFLEKIKNIATGRTESERKQIAEANKKIRQRALEIELKEREAQTLRLTQAKVRAKGDAKLKAIQNPKPMFSGMGSSSGFGNMFGQTAQPVQPKIVQSKPKYVYIKKGKKYIKKKVKSSKPSMTQQPKRFDFISGGWR